jgi:hypothetical protein
MGFGVTRNYWWQGQNAFSEKYIGRLLGFWYERTVFGQADRLFLSRLFCGLFFDGVTVFVKTFLWRFVFGGLFIFVSTAVKAFF